MLPRANRLTTKFDFQRVLKNKTFLHSNFFTGAYLESENKNPKIGIIVSNKVAKRATERNRIKRVVREVAHQYVSSIKPHIMLVLLTKKEAFEVENKKLASDVERIFKKLV